MNKGIISKIAALVIMLVIAQSIVWFFKISSTKRHLLTTISSSNGKVMAENVSVSGFPFHQKIVIDNFKFQTDDLSEKLYLSNKYQINIKHLEASSGVFSGDFKVNMIDKISFQDAAGNVGYVEFNQTPEMTFSIGGGRLTKLSYKDNGYKILDAAKNSIYEGGISGVDFESIIGEENKIHHKIKAEFKDVDGIDIFSGKKIIAMLNPAVIDNNGVEQSSSTTSSVENLGLEASNELSSAEPKMQDPIAVTSDSSASTAQASNSDIAKKSIYLEAEYILAEKNQESDTLPTEQNSVGYNLISGNIKSVEFTTPMYKVNFSGEFVTNDENDGIATCNAVIKVEKLDNILTYLKKDIVSPSSTSMASGSQLETSPEVTTISGSETSDQSYDISAVITNLAKANLETKDYTSIFEIKKDKDADFMINQTPLSEIITKLFPASETSRNPINESN